MPEISADAQDYIDKAITAEYEFQRKELYSFQSSPMLSPGLTLMIGLLAYVITNVGLELPNPKVTGRISILYLLFTLFTLVFAALLGARRRVKKVEDFAIEDVLTTGIPCPDSVMTIESARAVRLSALRYQMKLCRTESRVQRNLNVCFVLSLLVSLLSGAILAALIVGVRAGTLTVHAGQ